MFYGGKMINSMDDRFLGTVIVVYSCIIGVALLGALAEYIIRGIGMYKIGKAQGKENCWLAFIPYGRTYFQGELSGEILLKKKAISNPGIWMIVIPICSGIVMGAMYFIFIITFAARMVGYNNSMNYFQTSQSVTGMVGFLIGFIVIFLIVAIAFSAVMTVLKVLVNRQIYNRYTSTNMAIIHAVLGTVIPFYESIALLVFGRKAEQESVIDMTQENFNE